jgi:signal transduction histidine kinase
MKDKFYLDRIDDWLTKMNSKELKELDDEYLKDTRVHLDNYEYIFNKGLELIKSEPFPKDLLIKILDEYMERFSDLPNIGSGSIFDPDVDAETKEKLKALMLFGTQAALIKENSRIQNDLRVANQNYMDLLSIVTHEFKNSLTSIYGYNRIIKKRIEEERPENLKDITSNVDKLSKNLFNLVETLLNLSLIEQDKLRIDNVEYSLMGSVIEPIMHEMQLQLEEKHMAIEVISKEDDIRLSGDYGLLQIALRNLIINAIQYGFEKTDIEIRVEKVIDRILLEVYNKGVGIEKEYIPFIFEKFARFHNQNKKTNVGIGLYTVKHIVELHRGTIKAESRPGEWMRFLINLPAKKRKGYDE